MYHQHQQQEAGCLNAKTFHTNDHAALVQDDEELYCQLFARPVIIASTFLLTLQARTDFRHLGVKVLGRLWPGHHVIPTEKSTSEVMSDVIFPYFAAIQVW